MVARHTHKDRLEAAHGVVTAASLEVIAGAQKRVLGHGHVARPRAGVLGGDDPLIGGDEAARQALPARAALAARQAQVSEEGEVGEAGATDTLGGGGQVPAPNCVFGCEAHRGGEVSERAVDLGEREQTRTQPGAALGVLGSDAGVGVKQRPRPHRVARLEEGATALEEEIGRLRRRRRHVLVRETHEIAAEMEGSWQASARQIHGPRRLGDARGHHRRRRAPEDVAFLAKARAQDAGSEGSRALIVERDAGQRAVGRELNDEDASRPGPGAAADGDDRRSGGAGPDEDAARSRRQRRRAAQTGA